MKPEKIDLNAATISEEKIAQLQDLLPEVFHEGTINFDELRNALGDYVEDDPNNERFGLRWPGKSKLQQVINTPSVGTLVPQPEESVDWDSTENVIIEGDNLEVLKLLQKSYAGKVKMIYIDPPYNTGNDFVYPDKYASGMDTYLELTGQKDENGSKLTTNTDTSGRYHANWLNMMYPRLYLARNLLRHDGVIFVSIGSQELANLILLGNSVFGSDAHLGTVTWKARVKPVNIGIAKYRPQNEVEYVVIYARDQAAAEFYPIITGGERAYPHSIGGRKYRLATILKSNRGVNHRSTMTFEIDGYSPPEGQRWQAGESVIRQLIDDGYLEFVNGTPFRRYFEDEEGAEHDPFYSFMETESSATSESGKHVLNNLLGPNHDFDTVKPTELIRTLLMAGSSPDSSQIVLDFFAGSGTTGHAVMQQNAEDGGNRKYIMVQLPEPMEKKVLDDGTELNTIADVCRERIRRAGKRIADENPDKELDTGFRAFKLAPSNFTPWDGTNDSQPETRPLLTSARQVSFMPQTEQLTLEERILHAADHLSPDASDIAVLTELLLKLGEELTVPVEELTLAGKTVYDIDDNLRLICLERNLNLDVIRAMAEREPAEIICLDAGFPDDQTKVNAGQIIATQARNAEAAIAFKVV